MDRSEIQEVLQELEERVEKLEKADSGKESSGFSVAGYKIRFDYLLILIGVLVGIYAQWAELISLF